MPVARGTCAIGLPLGGIGGRGGDARRGDRQIAVVDAGAAAAAATAAWAAAANGGGSADSTRGAGDDRWLGSSAKVLANDRVTGAVARCRGGGDTGGDNSDGTAGAWRGGPLVGGTQLACGAIVDTTLLPAPPAPPTAEAAAAATEVPAAAVMIEGPPVASEEARKARSAGLGIRGGDVPPGASETSFRHSFIFGTGLQAVGTAGRLGNDGADGNRCKSAALPPFAEVALGVPGGVHAMTAPRPRELEGAAPGVGLTVALSPGLRGRAGTAGTLRGGEVLGLLPSNAGAVAMACPETREGPGKNFSPHSLPGICEPPEGANAGIDATADVPCAPAFFNISTTAAAILASRLDQDADRPVARSPRRSAAGIVAVPRALALELAAPGLRFGGNVAVPMGRSRLPTGLPPRGVRGDRQDDEEDWLGQVALAPGVELMKGGAACVPPRCG